LRTLANERETQKAILDLLAAEGVFAFRLNTAAFRVISDGRGKERFFRSHSLGAGAADIRADVRVHRVFWKGTPQELIVDSFVPLWLEVKSAKGGQSPEQASFQGFVESHGHVYAVVHSVDDVLDVLWRIRGKKP
jgi:hypothetical protein